MTCCHLSAIFKKSMFKEYVMSEESKSNNRIFIVGVVCLVLSVSFLFFSLYIIPYLLWELHYDVPDFVAATIASVQNNYNYSSSTSKFIVWLLFLIPSLVMGFISYLISNRIDKETKL